MHPSQANQLNTPLDHAFPGSQQNTNLNQNPEYHQSGNLRIGYKIKIIGSSLKAII